ncbi:MAG: mannitol dehydrogenase family protein [Paracoccaceae bacterium]
MTGSAPPRLRRSAAPRPKVGIVHLGPGAFFRAFCAVYTAEALQSAGGDWGITAVSLRSTALRDAILPQGCAYTAVTLASQGARYDVIDVIDDVLVAPENPRAVLAAMADEGVKIVSMTITEKGYCHNPAASNLRFDHPDIAHDLTHPDAPRSAVGFLVRALARRRDAGTPAFTVLSCDNLPDNGALTRTVVLAFAQKVSPDLAEWIKIHARFPATMVDRITPATTDADVAMVAQKTGYLDKACVLHEPFRQWVIEDGFVAGQRPAWDAAGAQFVGDVTPFEIMKLRCLNGTHSALAYLGYLAGYETICETVADPAFAAYIDRLWTAEIIPTVPAPEGIELAHYTADLKDRYLNPHIRHRTWQIAMDGSQKLPQRLLGTAADCLKAGRSISGLALAVAGWMRYVGGVDEQGGMIDVRDPLATRLKAASEVAADPAEKVTSLLAVRDVFSAELAKNPDFASAVTASYVTLAEKGAKAAVQASV